MTFSRADFPKDFLFGVATSAYQIEGHAAGCAGRTHWDDFAAVPGNVAHAEHGGRACDHYHRWEEDLDLVRDAGFDCYRFSASWARVMPEGRGRVNAEGLAFYDRLVDGMLERGLKPSLTLYHWEMPSALLDLGGWRNRDVAGWFADYTEALMRRIGDRIWATAPVNEPWCVAWLSHFLGHHAPGVRDIRAAARAMHHVLLAHGSAIEALRGLGLGNLGAVCNFEHVIPADGSEASAAAARRHDAILNRWFVSALFNRQYPAEALEGLAPHLPEGWEKDFDHIARPLDWFGLNYYTRKLVCAEPGPWPGLREVEGPLARTQMGWEIYPDGLAEILRRIHEGYTRGLPLMVTENGMASADRIGAGGVQDSARIAFIEDHLTAVRRAQAEGVPVQAYHVWSLLDNFEWSFGYEKRFGLVHVDFQNLQRTPKASYHALARALAR
ncbi:GH1 family beta-glucosidase [Cereibacter azotoformans]|uniref:GH1 family beta-glucosidase n=1 Tax=Cereibacter azotoformans TaxID=43057 RepID=UPI003B2113AC